MCYSCIFYIFQNMAECKSFDWTMNGGPVPSAINRIPLDQGEGSDRSSDGGIHKNIREGNSRKRGRWVKTSSGTRSLAAKSTFV